MNKGELPELPGGWVWTRLGDVADYINGKAFKPTDWENVGRPIIRIQNLTGSTDTINRYSKPIEEVFIVRDGDFLISWSATLGAYIYRGEEAVLNQHIFKVIPYTDKQFLFYLTSFSISQLMKKIHGSGMQHITKGVFESYQFPLPPLPEQRRIVTKIEELFTRLEAGVSELEKTQAQLKRYRQSVLKAACEGKLVPTEAELARAEGRGYEAADVLLAQILKERREKLRKGAKYKEPAAPASVLTALPEGWCWATFEQIGEWYGGGTPSTRNSSYWIDGTIPWISPKDMKTLRIHDSEDKITEKALENSAAKLISSGSILFVVRSGILRRTLPVALTMVDATVNQDIKSLTPDTSIDPDYILVTALAFNEDIRHSCAKDGTTVESIEVPALQIYAIPLPPLSEQRRIVAEVERRLSIADGVERTVEQSLAQAQRLRQSILKKAFEGRLVAQDVNDEPAGVLLERIKAEKMQRKEGKRKPKTKAL